GGQCPYWISPRRPFAQPPPSQALELLIAEDGIAVALAQELENRHNQRGGVKHFGICGHRLAGSITKSACVQRRKRFQEIRDRSVVHRLGLLSPPPIPIRPVRLALF